MTHKDELLDWFAESKAITPAEAVQEMRNFRLADTVYNLRQDGHTITTEMVERTRKDGRTVRWARYHYVSGPSEAVAA